LKKKTGGFFMTVITISRQFGAGGELVAQTLAKKLGFLLVNREVIAGGLKELGLPAQMIRFDELVGNSDEWEKKRRFYLTALHEYIMGMAEKESIVLLGRGGQFLFRNRPDAFHLFIRASYSQRVEWIQEINGLEKKAASLLIREQDRRKKRYIRQIFDQSWYDMELYDLILNTGKISPQGVAKIALQAFAKFNEVGKRKIERPQPEQTAKVDRVSFMHPSEKEFAKVLDYYNIPWEYEPDTFPLQWDGEGRVTEAFSPDFYLPEQKLYVELTTQRQKLVWKKNKKMRRLKELHPEVNVKIVYGKDYHSMLKKFGLDN
jgi:cytidylate kinase